MTDSTILIANERYKAISTGLAQGGIALLGTGAAAIYLGVEDSFWPLIWISVSIALIFSAWLVLSLLQADQ